LPEYTPHAFRKTLTALGDELCRNQTEFKAWSMNLGHDNVATTINSYLQLTVQGQLDTIRKMAG
jgi:hypothetical protein